MLGPPKLRDLDRPVVALLDALVPKDNFYRHLEKVLDLSFVRDSVKDCYAECGRPSVDPVVFFKLQLITVLQGTRSERQLMEHASLNLAHRWYVGYSLDEPLPDHSTLTKIRQRLGIESFRRFFDQIVALRQRAGLIWGKELIFDATKVRANASLDSVVPRLQDVVDGHLVELFAADDADPSQDAEPDDSAPPLLHPEAAASGDAVGELTPKRWDWLEKCRLDPRRPSSSGVVLALFATL